MRTSEAIVVGYMIYLAVLAWLMPLTVRRRVVVTAVAGADVLATLWLASRPSAAVSVARDWLPVLHILIGYWLSGAFFRGPMLRVEAWLARGDRVVFDRWAVERFVRRAPRWALELLELAYLSVYLLVPLGFALALAVAPALDVDRYWTIVVAAELGAYALLPWIQTRTPRTLGDHTAIDGRGLIVRRLNLAIGRGASIRVNTMPSGHAAGAAAIALAVFEVSPAAGAGVFAVAAAIVAGSVIGRYHFAIDGLLGVLLAVVVWALV